MTIFSSSVCALIIKQFECAAYEGQISLPLSIYFTMETDNSI